MLIVLDTNVLISGLFNPFGAPGRILDLILAGEVHLAYDDRILAEYREIMLRPRFGFDPFLVRALVEYLAFSGKAVSALPLQANPIDPEDLPFAEVAVAARAQVLVTGNPTHFAFLHDLPVLSPGEFLEYWARQSGG